MDSLKHILFVILLISLSACSIQSTVPGLTTVAAVTIPAPATAAPTLVPTATSLPSSTTIHPPAYPPPPTSSAPEPTKIAFPTPQLPEVTGPVDGPWIVYQTGSRNEPGAGVTLVVSDLAGKNHNRIELPPLTELRDAHWDVILPPRGNFLAAHRVSPRIPKDDPGYEIWLFSLKDGKLVRKIKQFTDEALLEIRKFPDFFPRGHSMNEHPILSAINGGLEWSPDGRYLAFSAVLEGIDVNLYTYDAQTDSIRQLSYQIHQARFRSWSPDGHYIIYNQEIASDTYFDQGSWLVDLTTGQTRYLSQVRIKDLFQWISSADLLLCEFANESPCLNLRRLNLASGQEKMLYSKISTGAAEEPLFGVIFLLKGGHYAWPAGETGIYRLYEDGSLEKLVSGDFIQLQWNAALRLFTVFDESNLDAVAYTLNGVEKLRFPAAGIFNVSPDGNWVGAAGNLYHADGTLVSRIGLPEKILWAPDSNSFYRVESSGDIFLFRKSTGWQGELIDSQSGIRPLGIVQLPVK